ncbi:MAG: hypothetical protein R3C68_12710 [Myxococcota bacterium]
MANSILWIPMVVATTILFVWVGRSSQIAPEHETEFVARGKKHTSSRILTYQIGDNGNTTRLNEFNHPTPPFNSPSPMKIAATISILALFVANEEGRIYWLYPAWTDASANPSSIPITSGERRASGSGPHTHSGPQLTLYALFTETPVTVRAVETWYSQTYGDDLNLTGSR